MHLVPIDSQTSQLNIQQLEQLLKTAKDVDRHCEIDWVNRTIRILSEKKKHVAESGKIFAYWDIVMWLNG